MKTTLLIDGNWLMMSRLYAMPHAFSKDLSDDDKLSGSYKLAELMAQSINKVLRKFEGAITNIIMISDGGSWRKQVKKPQSMQNVKYKGNRSLNESMDWDYIYKSLNLLTESTKNLGITTCNHPGIEGDDWCWYWTRKLNKMGINTIIWSSDNDLKQLVQVSEGAFTVWYNEKNGLFIHKDLSDTNDIDFFMRIDRSNSALDLLKQMAGNYEFINPEDIVMSKIIVGDMGDNIKSILRIEKNSRTYKVADGEWNRVKGSLNIRSLEEFLHREMDIIDRIIHDKKYRGYDIDVSEVTEMFSYNTKLVWLHESTIPESAIQRMNEEEYKEFDLSYIINNYKAILAPQNKEVESLLPF